MQLISYIRHISLKALLLPLVLMYLLPAPLVGAALGQYRNNGLTAPLVTIFVLPRPVTPVHDDSEIVTSILVAVVYFVAVAPFLAASLAARLASALPLLHGLLIGAIGCALAISILPTLLEVGLWWAAISLALALIGAVAFRKRTVRA